jgi:arylsulfatase A-like enzyme
MMKFLKLGCSFCLLWVLSGEALRAAEKPNVLFLAVDDLNDWVGVLGKRTDVKTPNIDKLAKQGVLFTRAYCAAPACNPSRAALLTGLNPATTGVYLNSQPWRPVLKDAVTLPQYFQKQGYRVEGGGKIFHNSFNDLASWDHWEKAGPFPSPEKVPNNGIPNTAHFDWGPVQADDKDMGDYHTAKWAADFLSQPQEKPFFLAVGMIRPHLPFYAPQKYFDLYPLDQVELPKTIESDLSDIPPAGIKMAKPDGDHRKVLEAKQWKHAVQAYLACITFTDAMLGIVLDALEKSPHAKNTIIVLWSDHGWSLGEKEHWRKFALWEEPTRVTLTITAPGVTKPNQICERTVGLIDLYPTLLDLCGLPDKGGLDGVSLVPLLKNPATEWNRPALTTQGRNNHAIRSERYRYIRYADGSEELYDHQADPYEWKNLANVDNLTSVKQDLAKHLPKTNAENAPDKQAKKKNKK